ncbi:hypothetical protein ACE939_04165 [Aquimarina sp. W85]|uniref:right-handed parallel beta-helix repeat-containing protein n=1 Tax=Aquimarina rhodophyticola TaxID=3342246 RepID=UPI00366FD517
MKFIKLTFLTTFLLMSCSKEELIVSEENYSKNSTDSSNSCSSADYLITSNDSKNSFYAAINSIQNLRENGDTSIKTICIESDVVIEFNKNDRPPSEWYFFKVPSNVEIKGNGAVFKSQQGAYNIIFALITESNITLNGIVFKNTTEHNYPLQIGVKIFGDSNEIINNITIKNCDISGNNRAAIDIFNAKNVFVENNYIHHNFGTCDTEGCRTGGLGYGISVGDGSTVQALNNRFLYNRHAIASSNITENSHYIARGNTVLQEYNNDPIIRNYSEKETLLNNLNSIHHFDAHGSGNNGQNGGSTGTFVIEENVFYNNRSFAANNNKIISIRGIPRECSYVRNNIFPNGNGFDNLKQSSGDNSLIIPNCSNNQFKNIIIEGNTANNEPSAGLIKNLIVFKENGDLINYPTLNDLKGNGILVGNGFSQTNYSDYLVANWTGNGTSDLIVRNTQGELRALKFNGSTFYGQTINGESFPVVAHGFSQTNYSDYLVGDWTGNGTSDLIVRNTQGELRALKFNGSTFYGQTINGESFPVVAHGFSQTNYSDYLVGDWTGNGTSDLIVRNTQGELRALKFNGSTFYGQTINGESFPVVANGINESYFKFIVADWTNDAISDLLMVNLDGDIFINKFNGVTFYGQTINGKSNPVKVFDGSLYKDYYIGDFTGDQYSDLLVIDNSNDVFLLKYNPSTVEFGTPNLITTNFEYSKILIGDWNN